MSNENTTGVPIAEQFNLDDLLFLDAPVDTTHNHYEKIDPIVQKLKSEYGYDNRLDERTCLYRKKRFGHRNPLNADFLKDELRKQDYEKRVRECVEMHLNKDGDVELDELLNRGEFELNAELYSKKMDFIHSIEEYNRIIQYQLVKELVNVKSIQTKLSIDFQLKIQEIKDFVVTIEEYQRVQKKLEDLLVQAPKSLGDARKKDINLEIQNLEHKQEEYLCKITQNIDLILNSENVTSSPIKTLLLYQMESMLYFLSELQSRPKNYLIFLRHCKQIQSITLTNINIFDEEGMDTHCSEDPREAAALMEAESTMEMNQGRFLLEHEAKKEEREFLEGNKLQYPQGTVYEKNPYVLQLYEKKGRSENEMQKTITEQLSKIQQRSQNYFLKKEKNEQMSSAPEFSKGTIKLELQNLERFHTKLSNVERILGKSKLQKYPDVQKYLKILWQYLNILAIQISCARNRLEKYLISMNNKTFVPHILERIIRRTIGLLSGMPDHEQAKSYLENQRRYNTFKRYQNDLGKITNYHFVLNANNLKPVLQKMDPNRFLSDTKKLPKAKINQVPRKRHSAKTSPVNHLKKAATSSILNSTIISDMSPTRDSIIHSEDSTQQHQQFTKDANQPGTTGEYWGIGKNTRERSISGVSHSSNSGGQLNSEGSQKLRSVSTDQDFQYNNNNSPGGFHSTKQNRRISQSLHHAQLQQSHPYSVLNISAYINNQFDSQGLNNYFCEKAAEIDIDMKSQYAIGCNIFSQKQDEVIDIDEFIESNRKQSVHSFATPARLSYSAVGSSTTKSHTPLDTKELFKERFKQFKETQKSIRYTTAPSSTTSLHPRRASTSFKASKTPSSSLQKKVLTPEIETSLDSSTSTNFYQNKLVPFSPKSTFKSSFQQNRQTPLSVTFYCENERTPLSTEKQNNTPINKLTIDSQSNNNFKQSFSSSLSTKRDIKSALRLHSSSAHSGQSSTKDSTLHVEFDESTIEQKTSDKDEGEKETANNPEELDNSKLQSRNYLMHRILERKRPRYICIGKSNVTVKGTAQEISKMEKNVDIAQLRSKDQEKIKNRAKLQQKISQINKQLEVSNIEVLSGPPKKYYVEISTIQSDFNDRIISKIIKR